jgi:chemotaxis protein histidine kinase CheA
MVHVKAEEMLRNILIHVLRHSMDHGIETPAERQQRGKPAAGHIYIGLDYSHDRLRLHYRDDGRGLNLGRIRAIGLRRALVTSVTAAIPKHLADLIFDSGISTSKRITDISGRGVGMDAVRRYLAEYDGTIRVILDKNNVIDDDFYPFELLIELPMDLFTFPSPEAEHQAA